MNRQLRRNLFDTFLYNPLTPFFKGESREGSYSFTGSKRSWEARDDFFASNS